MLCISFLFPQGHTDSLNIYLPINRCGNLLLCSELQGVNNPKQLIEVPPRGGRVEDGQLQFLVRADHKHLGGVDGQRIQKHFLMWGTHCITLSTQQFTIYMYRKRLCVRTGIWEPPKISLSILSSREFHCHHCVHCQSNSRPVYMSSLSLF